jgi:hypothetical protein
MVELYTDRCNKWKVTNWKGRLKTELIGRSALWGRNFALDFSAIEEGEGEKGEEEEGGGGEEEEEEVEVEEEEEGEEQEGEGC